MRGRAIRHLLPLASLLVAVACAPTIGEPNAGDTSAPSATATPDPAAANTTTPNRTPAPTITLDASGLPVGAVGPLLLYRTALAGGVALGTRPPETEIVIYDVAANVELGRIAIDDPSGEPRQSFLAGTQLPVNFGDILWRYSLDGHREQLMAAPVGTMIASMAIDESGRFVVVTLHTGTAATPHLQWLDVASGELLREETLRELKNVRDPLPRIVGAPDEATLLLGTENIDRSRTYGILEADGSIREYGTAGSVIPSPDGRFLAHGPTAEGCTFQQSGRIELLALTDHTITVAFEDDSMALTPWEWAPDGSEFAFEGRRITQLFESCYWTTEQARWFVLSTDGTVREAPSQMAIRTQWYGERAVSFACASVLESGARGALDGLLRPAHCARGTATIRVAGIALTEAENVRILGFVEVD